MSQRNIAEISSNDAQQSLSDYQVVDVRSPGEYLGELGHIEGARLVPLGELAQAFDLLEAGKPVLTVCRSGSRSLAAAMSLTERGFDATNLSGGMIAWRAAGLPVSFAPTTEPQKGR